MRWRFVRNPVLKLAMLLALGCSMRIGEILGLTWDCVDLSEEALASGNASLFINKELKRCEKSSVEALEKRGRSKVFLRFRSGSGQTARQCSH